MFRNIPTVLTGDELLDKAFRRAGRTQGKGRTPLVRARNGGMAKLNAVRDVVGETLGTYVKAFPSVDQLPPFYLDLVDVLVGKEELKHHLGTIGWARDQVRRVVAASRRPIARARNRDEVGMGVRAAYGRAASVVHQVAPSLGFLGGAREAMRHMPDIDADIPTIVVAGAPNVGKSQLVRALSTGRPRVASYPFTTKQVTVGHFEDRGRAYQVIDTPGLLDRPADQRNLIERQAVAALRHVAHVVLFLTDPSETCGYPWDYQMAILRSLADVLPSVPVVRVENKADLTPPRDEGPRVSALTGKGVERLRALLVRQATSRAPAASRRAAV